MCGRDHSYSDAQLAACNVTVVRLHQFFNFLKLLTTLIISVGQL